jgi:hypothetical protein
MKPHLFLPFGVVLAAWVLVSRSYKIAAGAAAAVAASCAITFLIDPLAWTQYMRMARASGIEKEYIPCLSYLLRNGLGSRSMALQFLPAALGCVWALSYFWPRRQAWDWMKNGNLPLLVSILAAPYCWLCDQGLLIPALLHGAYRTRSRFLLVILALASLLIEIELVNGAKIGSTHYLWTASAWLAWYLAAIALGRGPEDEHDLTPKLDNLSEPRVL